MSITIRGTRRLLLLSTTLLASAMTGQALAQETPAPDTTDVTDKNVKEIIIRAERSKAAAEAPSKASLDQGAPQSIVSRPFIEASVAETGDFTQIANIAPSMASGGAANGAGYGEAKITLRGFKDGNYNVTFDGIPWGDTNNPTHHSNSFFPASTVGATIIDRGPGAVGDIGQANYGGNIKMFSNKLTDDFGVTLRETVGSWNSWQSVAVVQSGKIKSLNNLSGFVNLQMNGSDGAQTFSSMHSSNATTKWTLPINDDLKITFFGMYNANKWHNSDNPGGTSAQIAQYGEDFNLTDDPNTPAYYGYNLFNKHTAFAYIKEEANLPWGIALDNTTYNIFYSNNTDTASNLSSDPSLITLTNPNGYAGLGTWVTTSNSAGQAKSHPSDIPGYNKLNHYMTWGNITRFTRDFSAGTLHAGIWLEKATTNRHTYDYDLTLNKAQDHREAAITGQTLAYSLTYDRFSYLELSSWWQKQIFADFAWKVTDKLTITPGIKNVYMKRTVNAWVIKSPRIAQNGSNTNTKTLSNLSVNYKLAKNWSVYGQYAEGMYMPDIAALYVKNPSANTAEPQLSTNYQFGTVYQGRHVAVDADIYRIDLTNLLAADSAQNTYVNIGKGKATGAEGQVSYTFDSGVTLFVNGSHNRYIDTLTGFQISGAPISTLGLGALYHKGPWSGSLIAKEVGKQYADNVQAVPIKAFETVDLAVNYDFGKYRIKAQVSNLLGNRAITSIKTNSNAKLWTYGFLPGTNAELTLIAKF